MVADFMIRICFLFLALAVCASAAEIRWRPMGEPGSGGAQTSVAVSPWSSNRVLLGGDMLGAGLSENRGLSWQATTGFRSWEIADFTFHPMRPNEVWAGTMSGPYVSMNGGKTWLERRAGFPEPGSWFYSAPIQAVLFDPGNSQRLLAFGGSHRRWESPGQPQWGAVWESTDGGANWSKISTVADGRNIVSVAWASNGVVYAAADGRGVWRSDDRGASWRECASPGNPNVNSIALHPKNPDVLWAAAGPLKENGGSFAPGGVWKSTDGCASWQDSSAGLNKRRNANENLTSRYEALAISRANPDRLFTSDTSWDGASVWRSNDGGKSWESVLNYGNRAKFPTAYAAGPGMTVIGMDPNNANTIFVSGTEYVYRSLDAGATWEDMTAVKTADGAWKGRGFSGLVSVNFRFNPWRAGEAALVAMDDGKLWISGDNLESWRWYGFKNWEGGNDAVFAGAEGSVVYATFGQFGINGGVLRKERGEEKGTLTKPGDGQPMGVYAVPDSPDEAWAAVNGKLWATKNGGRDWTKIHDGPGLRWMAGSGRTFYAGGDAGVYKSGGDGALQFMPGSPAKAERITLDPRDPSVLYVTVWRQDHGGLWRFKNDKWERIRDDRYIFDVALDPFDERRMVVTTDDHPYHDYSYASGVWMSEDGGATWKQQNAGLAMHRGAVVRFDPHTPGRLVLGTAGRGYFVGTLGEEEEPGPGKSIR
jgi:hypothetical protein